MKRYEAYRRKTAAFEEWRQRLSRGDCLPRGQFFKDKTPVRKHIRDGRIQELCSVKDKSERTAHFKTRYFMTIEHVPTRPLFEDFHADIRFADLRQLRSQLQPTMQVLRGNVTGFQHGGTVLRPEKIQSLREYVLQMLQLQHAMTEACQIMPVEFEPVKDRILADFDTEEPKAYLKQVNSWLRLIEGSD